MTLYFQLCGIAESSSGRWAPKQCSGCALLSPPVFVFPGGLLERLHGVCRLFVTGAGCWWWSNTGRTPIHASCLWAMISVERKPQPRGSLGLQAAGGGKTSKSPGCNSLC